MEFKLNINMDNAAFAVMPELELAALLEGTINSLRGGAVEGSLRDVNGNKVGKWEITED